MASVGITTMRVTRLQAQGSVTATRDEIGFRGRLKSEHVGKSANNCSLTDT